MNPWLETSGVIALATAGVGLGLWFSRLQSRLWLLGYVLPLLLILQISAARWFSALEFVPPFSWVLAGRAEFALIALIATMVLTTPMARLPQRRQRIAVAVFMVVVLADFSIWPFLAPAFNRNLLANLKTRIDRNGVCRQSTNYNCGPAAAVTALRILGLPAEEGQIAIDAHTSQAIGTPPDLLARALRRRYSNDGLTVEYRHFRTVDELPTDGLVLAVIKFGVFVDHYVTILAQRGPILIVADPLDGLHEMRHEEFRQKWRRTAIVLRRKT